jgi:hypothetical protein
MRFKGPEGQLVGSAKPDHVTLLYSVRTPESFMTADSRAYGIRIVVQGSTATFVEWPELVLAHREVNHGLPTVRNRNWAARLNTYRQGLSIPPRQITNVIIRAAIYKTLAPRRSIRIQTRSHDAIS